MDVWAAEGQCWGLSTGQSHSQSGGVDRNQSRPGGGDPSPTAHSSWYGGQVPRGSTQSHAVGSLPSLLKAYQAVSYFLHCLLHLNDLLLQLHFHNSYSLNLFLLFWAITLSLCRSQASTSSMFCFPLGSTKWIRGVHFCRTPRGWRSFSTWFVALGSHLIGFFSSRLSYRITQRRKRRKERRPRRRKAKGRKNAGEFPLHPVIPQRIRRTMSFWRSLSVSFEIRMAQKKRRKIMRREKRK